MRRAATRRQNDLDGVKDSASQAKWHPSGTDHPVGTLRAEVRGPRPPRLCSDDNTEAAALLSPLRIAISRVRGRTRAMRRSRGFYQVHVSRAHRAVPHTFGHGTRVGYHFQIKYASLRTSQGRWKKREATI